MAFDESKCTVLMVTTADTINIALCGVCLLRFAPPDRAQCLKSSSFTIDSFGVATPQDFQLANISGPYTWFNASQYEIQAPKCASKTPQCVSSLHCLQLECAYTSGLMPHL